jgi:hypothetical protein
MMPCAQLHREGYLSYQLNVYKKTNERVLKCIHRYSLNYDGIFIHLNERSLREQLVGEHFHNELNIIRFQSGGRQHGVEREREIPSQLYN